jgi:HlyD family secretion protein
MKAKPKILVVIIIVAAGIAAYIFFSTAHNGSSKFIHVSGNIEATEVRLSFQVPGKITQLLVDEGYPVSKGQTVARLDKNEFIQSKDNALAAFEKAQANYNWLKIEYERAENLLKTGNMTPQQRDGAKNQFEVTEAELKLRIALLEIAKINLGYTDLNSPVDSFVLTKSAEAGEVVQPGSTVFTVADLNDIWLTAYIIETDLGKVRLNQHAIVKIDTFPNKEYKGRISFISARTEFTPKQIQTHQERVKLVYRIKIAVTNANQELKPGMPADGYITVE